MKIVCPFCKNEADKAIGAINAAKKRGAPIYCNKACSGLARRSNISDEEKKKQKAEYDREYRDKNKDLLKIKKHEHFKKTYNPEQAAIARKANMHKHIERMRQPKWVKYKKEYDRKRFAKNNYGEYWESALLVNQIQSLYDDDEIRQINNLHNKSQKRKRQWQQKTK